MLGRRKVGDAGALGATDGRPGTGDEVARARLDDAIAQIDSSFSRDREARDGLESPRPASAGNSDVAEAIEQVTELVADLADRLEVDSTEKRALTDAITRLARHSAPTTEGAARVMGGTVFPSHHTSYDRDEISLVEEQDDAFVDLRSDDAAWRSSTEAGTVLGGLGLEANGRVFPLGDDTFEALTSRANIAVFTGEGGDAREALRLCRALLPDQVRVLGADHPATLTTRANIAAFTGECGDVQAALQLCRELLPDRVRVLGSEHPDTLTTRSDIAVLAGECGDLGEALQLSCELLLDRVRVLGIDHPDTLMTRSDVAVFTGECGNAREALRLCRELLPDRERVLGVDHPDTIATRDDIAQFESAVSAG